MKMKPILTEADLDAALDAGARIEFTACAPDNTYDMPPAFNKGAGGWIYPLRDLTRDDWKGARRMLREPEYGCIFRAFYPTDLS